MSTFLCTIAGRWSLESPAGRWSLESPWLDPLLIQSIYVQGSTGKVSIYGIRPWPKITTLYSFDIYGFRKLTEYYKIK